MSDRTFSIRELCDEFDVTPRTLRFYESRELLAPRREGQRRLFTVRDRARLRLILRGKRFGFSLSEIKNLLDLYDRDDNQQSQLAATLAASRRHHAELRARRAELDGAIADLEAQMAQIERMLAAKAPREKA